MWWLKGTCWLSGVLRGRGVGYVVFKGDVSLVMWWLKGTCWLSGVLRGRGVGYVVFKGDVSLVMWCLKGTCWLCGVYLISECNVSSAHPLSRPATATTCVLTARCLPPPRPRGPTATSPAAASCSTRPSCWWTKTAAPRPCGTQRATSAPAFQPRPEPAGPGRHPRPDRRSKARVGPTAQCEYPHSSAGATWRREVPTAWWSR